MLTSFRPLSFQGQPKPRFHTEAWLHFTEVQDGFLSKVQTKIWLSLNQLLEFETNRSQPKLKNRYSER